MPTPFMSSEEYDERAHALYNEGRYDDALDVLREGLALYPSAVELHIGVGYARLAREEFAWARRAFEEALVLDAEHEDALAGLGEVLLKFGQVDEAMQAFDRTLALGYEDLRPLNPRMIYASLTAYGEAGPERERKGFDQLAYWARSGLMDLMREPGTRPTQGLPGMGDHPTAVALYAGIVTALLQREKTGEGALVSTSLLANGLWSASCIAQGAMAGGDMPRYRETNLTQGALMRVYQASDGRWLQFNMVRTEELLSLMFAGLDALHLLEDERFDTPERMSANRGVLGDLIQDLIAQKPSDEWLATFQALEVPVNRVALVEEAVHDAQILENRMAMPAEDTLGVPLVVNHPIRVSSAPPVEPVRAPELGEHTTEILQSLGYSPEAIATLRAKGAI